ncbi:MAG: glycosyltransferase [Desulfobacterales bacterium]|nr:glycosyltransferase [Desulfobacterales bacterium]
MKFSKILFITCMPLEAPRSASKAFMGVLLDKYPDLFAWFSLRAPEPETPNPFDIPYGFTESFQRLTRYPHLKQFIKLFPWAWYAGKKAADFGRTHQVQVVLADLAFEAVVAGRVAARILGVPLLSMVHDDPVNRIRVKNYPSWLVNLYHREFEKTLRTSQSCAVISDYMGEIYQKRYGVKTITLFPGVEKEKCLAPRTLDSKKSPIIIGSVGSINSKRNWNILVESVNLLNQRHGKGKFRILHLGRPSRDLLITEDVEATGWLPEKEFESQLRRIDIGFLNWDFAPEMAETRRTSLPLKITTYIQAQVPMLALGPIDSTVVRYLNDYDCGLACTKPETKSFADQLENLVFNGDLFNSALNGVIAQKAIFSRQVFFKCFEQFVQPISLII